MLRFLKGFFGRPIPPDVTPVPEPVAPYKVEAPAPTLVVDGHGDVHEVKAEVKPKKTPAKKPAAKKAPAKKPAAMKAPAKPRTPK